MLLKFKDSRLLYQKSKPKRSGLELPRAQNLSMLCFESFNYFLIDILLTKFKNHGILIDAIHSLDISFLSEEDLIRDLSKFGPKFPEDVSFEFITLAFSH